jgi:hypothetical protein
MWGLSDAAFRRFRLPATSVSEKNYVSQTNYLNLGTYARWALLAWGRRVIFEFVAEESYSGTRLIS